MLSKLKTAPAVRYADNLSYQINICAGFQFSLFLPTLFSSWAKQSFRWPCNFCLSHEVACLTTIVCLSAAVKELGACEYPELFHSSL